MSRGAKLCLLSIVTCYLSLVVASSWAAEVASPLSPADAQQAFQLADAGLRIELAAAEPEVIDPVAIRFDEGGRLWVVQMTDYPLGNPAGGEPLSKIRVLEDRDGDGRFETATTFADKLLFATGVQPWRGGAFVTLSGALVYLKDTDGDGRADSKETWFEGFAEQNSQLRANHPRLALDNWIYVANGLRGGKVVNRKLGETEPINISGMDFRFDPLTGKAEAVSGNGQFGLCFDDWGNRFTCSNRNPVRHVVIEDRYLKANPGVSVAATVNDVAAFGEQSRIFPISRAWTTSNLHAGQFTAACGVYIYRGDLLPAEFQGNAFTCDPTGNLIHREIMQPAGPTFTSQAAYEGKEFLCSPDEWFRPVNMELGPDGALYVVDMYRCVIEHPDFVPEELKRRPDLRLGDDRGRIWRIVPAARAGDRGPGTGGKGQGAGIGDTIATRKRRVDALPLSTASGADLVALLEHANAWQRETAQRLLLERSDRTIAATLRNAAERSPAPQARVRAAWLLCSLDNGQLANMRGLFSDSDADVRRQACRIAQELSGPTAVGQELDKLLIDRDPAVRFQARLSSQLTAGGSGAFNPAQLVEFFRQEAGDPWLRVSLRLHLTDDRGAVLVRALTGDRDSVGKDLSADELLLVRELLSDRATSIAGSAAPTELAAAALVELTKHIRVPTNIAILSAMARGFARGGTSLAAKADPVHLARAREVLPALIKDAARPLAVRREMLDLLGYLPGATDAVALFAARSGDQSIRLAAIGALSRQPGSDAWRPLLADFARDTPAARRAIVDALLTSGARTGLLLDAMEAGAVRPSEIDAAQMRRLTDSRDSAIKTRALKLFAAAMPADRAQALAEYQPVLQMKGDARNGQAVFEKNCAVCHRIAGIGVNVAPDISDSRTKKPEQLLADILQPNRAIDNNYLGYTVRQADGAVLTGILAAETATSITLRQQGGKDAVISRSEIDELRSTGQSLMPEGVERQIPPRDMADLIAFIKHWRYLDGRTPLAEP